MPIKGITNPNFCTTNIACNDWDTQHSYYKSPESRMAKGILATQQCFPFPGVVLVSYFYECRMLIPPGKQSQWSAKTQQIRLDSANHSVAPCILLWKIATWPTKTESRWHFLVFFDVHGFTQHILREVILGTCQSQKTTLAYVRIWPTVLHHVKSPIFTWLASGSASTLSLASINGR